MCTEHLEQSKGSITVSHYYYCGYHHGIYQLFHNCLFLYLVASCIIHEGRDSELCTVIFPVTTAMPGMSWTWHMLERWNTQRH